MLLWFYRLSGDAEVAAELLQETWSRALAAIDGYRGELGRDAELWLWGIARRVAGEHERGSERERRTWARLGRRRLALTDEDIERIEDAAARDQLRTTVKRRLDELPQAQREAVRMHVICELSYEEVAARSGTSEQNARTRVSRALRRLGVELGTEYDRWREENL